MTGVSTRCQIEVLEKIISSFHSSGLTGETDRTEKKEDVLKFLVSKKLTSLVLKSYSERSANLEEGTSEELQEEIGKAVAITKAWTNAAVVECIAHYISDDFVERTKKSLLLRKLDILIRRQSVILELARQEKLVYTKNCEQRIELQKELFRYKETLRKKVPISHSHRTLTESEKKVFQKIAKINVMRKLITYIVRYMEIDLNDERWLDLFTSARDPVTIESFQD